MFISDCDFSVSFSKYSQRHFAKSFAKKYGEKKWKITLRAIEAQLQRSHKIQETALLDSINFSQEEAVGIFKLDFAVAGENQSPKTSGNRVVFGVNNKTSLIEVLLIYSKDNITTPHETEKIKTHIKNHFKRYKKYCV